MLLNFTAPISRVATTARAAVAAVLLSSCWGWTLRGVLPSSLPSSLIARAPCRGGASMSTMRIIDTCVNLQDQMFQGVYNGKQRHEPDFDLIMERAAKIGVERMIGVSGSLEDSRESLEAAKKFSNIFCTVGVHPTRCDEFEQSGDPEGHIRALCQVVEEGKDKVVAIGEIGLDYDREQFCSRDVQKKYFARQLQLAKTFHLPVIFHNRNTGGDFEKIVQEHRQEFSTGIVHSFTGSVEEMRALVDMNLYIGINGCGMKTQELLDMIKEIPLDRLVVETDAPWCGIKNSHASSSHVKTKFEENKKEKFVSGKMVKERNEPAQIVQVLEVIASVKGLEVEEVAAACYQNTINVLFASAT